MCRECFLPTCPPTIVIKNIHVFHMSILNKYVPNSSHVLDYKPLQLEKDLTNEERPIQFLIKG